MKRTSACVFLTVLAVVLGGCTSSAPRDLRLSASSPIGLVAFGLAPERPNLTIYVNAIDPATCRLLPGGNKRYSGGGLSFQRGERRFMVDDFRPGFYVITSMSETGGVVNFSHTFEARAWAFLVEAGRISYLGDLRLTPYEPQLAGHDDAALRQHLASFPNVTGETVHVPLFRTTFSYEREGPRIAGCTLQAI